VCEYACACGGTCAGAGMGVCCEEGGRGAISE
jgi:hypothetical protein